MKKTTTVTKPSSKKAATRKLNPDKPPVFRTWADAKNGLLIVSLLANLFVFCIWLTLHITTQYDEALYHFFINR